MNNESTTKTKTKTKLIKKTKGLFCHARNQFNPPTEKQRCLQEFRGRDELSVAIQEQFRSKADKGG